MNQLPIHRQIIHGRTHSRSWSAAEMDPIEKPDSLERLRWLRYATRQAERLMFLLAIAFVVFLCMKL